MASVVLSIRVRKELKEKMEEHPEIDWKREIERYIELRLRELEKNGVLEEIREVLAELEPSKAPAWRHIREDREK